MSHALTKTVQGFWNEFLATRGDLAYLKDTTPDAWAFGGNTQTANKLLNLVLEGKKTATCSLASVYLEGIVPKPEPNTYSIVLDSDGNPGCVIHLFETHVKRFSEIDEKHAKEEGEGGGTLAHWRKVHLAFFSAYENFHEKAEILCERFRVVFK